MTCSSRVLLRKMTCSSRALLRKMTLKDALKGGEYAWHALCFVRCTHSQVCVFVCFVCCICVCFVSRFQQKSLAMGIISMTWGVGVSACVWGRRTHTHTWEWVHVCGGFIRTHIPESECMCVGVTYAHTYLRVSACVWGCHVSMTPPHTSHTQGVSCEYVTHTI